ncbi:MAG: bifunctional phosphoribosylaminoimidazolecarboxamide formyltransferase/IMP cyclohydrolase [Pseudomonadota bacterium]
MQDKYAIKRALISVSDKTGLDKIGRRLQDCGVEIISSGGTRKYLEDRQIACTPIEQVTGNPEAFGGRMKTISFPVASALLYRRENADDQKQAADLGIAPIDLVICNLYPFEEVARRDHEMDDLIEHIDIGGPTMVRAAAKNFNFVCICTDPDQYDVLMEGFTNNNAESDLTTRQNFALAAFRHTARYDAVIANQIEQEMDIFPVSPVLSPETATALRYGENPHQRAWLYRDPMQKGLASAEFIQGKALSYNNYLDADAAWRSNGDLNTISDQAAVTVIKHLNPCGAATAIDAVTALKQAWAGDPVSSFGSIICFNKRVDKAVAEWLSDKFVEVIIAPDFDPTALALFSKKKNLRLLRHPVYNGQEEAPVIRSISGGWLVQDEDNGVDSDFQTVTKAVFSEDKLALARFGTMVGKHLKSNAIGLVKQTDNGMALIGAGMGNPNRLISLHQAVDKARDNGHEDLSDVVLISDAFFPFADNIEIAAGAGIKFIIQPGGSIKDDQVIAACDTHNIAMSFTGRRHFRH